MAATKSQAKTNSATSPSTDSSKFLFGKNNFIIMFAGISIMVIGYLCMSGGRQTPDKWNADEIYSFTRVSLSSILVMLGFGVVMYSILKKRKA